MKKMLALALVACMSLSMVACAKTTTSEAVITEATEESKTVEATEGTETNVGVVESSETTEPVDAAESDLAYVTEKGTLVVGITDFAPMDYKDDNGNWIGFDADLATKFAESLGVTVEFVEIDWDGKVMELDSKNIDVVWNGMTLTDGVKKAMATTGAYLNNQQVIVVKAENKDKYTDVEQMKDLVFAVESGSAGEEIGTDLGLKLTPVEDQARALMEVEAGTSDACIIDLLMAGAMIGEGTSYPTLTYTIGLSDEEYGVGFRPGSDLAALLDEFFKASYKDGTMIEIAKTYGVNEALVDLSK